MMEKYDAVAKEVGAVFLPFALDIYGRMSAECRSFLSSVVTDMRAACPSDDEKQSITLNATIVPALSRALALGNGTCFLLSGRLRDIGMEFGRAATTTPKDGGDKSGSVSG